MIEFNRIKNPLTNYESVDPFTVTEGVAQHVAVMEKLIKEIRHRHLTSPTVARAIRIRAGVTQARLAKELRVARVTISRWESGARRPTGRNCLRYAALLNRLASEGREK